MAHPHRSYITTPLRDTDLRHFTGRIEQYDVLTGADSLDTFMRHCVSNRLLHDMALSPSPAENSPDCDILRISEYEMFSHHDDVLVHPVDEIAMEDATVPCWPSAEESKVIFITDFLGPRAQWPLLFFWRPASGRLGLYLPYLPTGPDALEEQDTGPLIPWAHVLSELQEGRRIASEPEMSWRPGLDTGEFQGIFMLLVKFFRGRVVEEDAAGG